MALILSLETSATICSCALHQDGILLKEAAVFEGQAHASKLAVLIKDLFNNLSIEIKSLQAVAVSSGPGSYTGLRIGTSTAKGLCYALNIPLIGIPTLQLLVSEVVNKEAYSDFLFCPMIDARRMEVFCQIVDSKGNTIQPVQAMEIFEHTFGELLEQHQMLFLGDAALKCKPVLTQKNAFFEEGIVPQAHLMGNLAFEKFKRSEFEDLINFVPFYLKDFVAKKARSVF
jgi:tRNA threonylcarbamoyladenosine biosynthesis protein TsaB